MYGGVPGQSEELLGAALAGHRDDVVIATKFGMDTGGLNGPDWGVRGSRRYVRRAVESSLRRLGTDHVDLFQMHAPDPVTPIEETLAALHELVVEGKVRYIGSSNFAAWQVVDADWSARTAGATPFVSAQNRYNLLDRSAEAELVPAAEQVGVGLIPFVPLASGLLTGKYRRGAGRTRRDAAHPDARPAGAGRLRPDRGAGRRWPASGASTCRPWRSAGSRRSPPWRPSSRVRARPSSCARTSPSIAWEPTLEQLAAIDEAAPGPSA